MSKLWLAIALSLGLLIPTAASRAADSTLGKKVDNFSLRDFHGNAHSLDKLADKKVVVLVFLGADCPLARLYAPRLSQLSREYAGKDVAILGVDANVQDTPTKLTNYARSYKVEFPILLDAGNALADTLGATRTPEAFVLDQDRVVRYHGRIDDQYVVGATHDTVRHRDMAGAIDELLSGKQVGQPATTFTGCLISRGRKTEPKGEIT
jgi:peroxiredoxin